MSRPTYQPGSRWDRKATPATRHGQQQRPEEPAATAAPRQGERVEIGGRTGVVVIIDPRMNLVEVDWDDQGIGVPGGHCSFWSIAAWKRMWGEK